MGGDEAGFITDPKLAARFMRSAKMCGAWSPMDVVENVPVFPRNLATTAPLEPALPPIPPVLLAKVPEQTPEMWKAVGQLYDEFSDACETLEELLQSQSQKIGIQIVVLASSPSSSSFPL